MTLGSLHWWQTDHWSLNCWTAINQLTRWLIYWCADFSSSSSSDSSSWPCCLTYKKIDCLKLRQIAFNSRRGLDFIQVCRTHYGLQLEDQELARAGKWNLQKEIVSRTSVIKSGHLCLNVLAPLCKTRFSASSARIKGGHFYLLMMKGNPPLGALLGRQPSPSSSSSSTHYVMRNLKNKKHNSRPSHDDEKLNKLPVATVERTRTGSTRSIIGGSIIACSFVISIRLCRVEFSREPSTP